MLPERIPGANRAHGEPKDWDAILNAGGSVRTAINAAEQHPIIRSPTVVAAGEF